MSRHGETDGLPRRLAALLSADAAGYSRLMSEDDLGTVRTLETSRSEIRRLAEAHHGRVVDSPGDNMLVEFPSALDAMRCAIEVQRKLKEHNDALPPERHMPFRIGVHLGDVVVDGDRIYGDGVNVAARLEGHAEPGGICLSRSVYELVRDKIDVVVEDLGEQSFKNIPYPLRVYRVRSEEADLAMERPLGLVDPEMLRRLAHRRDIAILVVPATWVLYVTIVLEILFMISPLGVYYYAAYGPTLNLLHESPWTAWLSQFFLPHFSDTTSPVLNTIYPAGELLILLGGTLFVVGFVQLYTAKLRGRGLVNRGLYALSSHPQYLALGILGLGTLLVWPRFLVLLTYVTVVFLYVVLARLEERRCLVEFGDQYRRYTERSRSRALRQFLTWLPALPAAGIPRAGVVFALYVLALAASVVVGLRLRDYALAHLSAVYMSDAAVLSPAVLSQEELTAAWEVARSAGVVDKIAAEGRGGKLLVYVVPLDWEIPDLPLPLPEKRPRGHYKPPDFDRSRFRVLFATPRSHRHDLEGREIVARSYGLNPEALVQVDLKTRGIIQREEPPPHVFWGDVPTPLF